jgi:hypothetical protein
LVAEDTSRQPRIGIGSKQGFALVDRKEASMTPLHETVREFFERRKEGTLEPDASLDVHDAAHAVEDLPLQARAEGTQVLESDLGTRVQRRELDGLKHTELNELESDAAHAGGELELVFKFLAQYPVKNYRYDVAPDFLTRGDRPDVAKLNKLADDKFTATLSLCKETTEGDRPLIEKAVLGDRLAPLHVSIVDGTPPTTAQVIEILSMLAGLEAKGNERVYVHCEAGKGRTGVIVACYRLAVMGWTVEQALTEASNFGCSVPAQLQFIADFGERLGDVPGYPRMPLGSAEVTTDELETTLEDCAEPDRD